MGVNLYGVFNCMRSVLPHLSRGGSMVNISGASGQPGVAGFGVYSASQHGIIGLSKSAAKEHAHRHIRVNAVCP
jgi:NAD(P)-dependent dehydrogenase (short-subunit alcohol dehydrogenase family)